MLMSKGWCLNKKQQQQAASRGSKNMSENDGDAGAKTAAVTVPAALPYLSEGHIWRPRLGCQICDTRLASTINNCRAYGVLSNQDASFWCQNFVLSQ